MSALIIILVIFLIYYLLSCDKKDTLRALPLYVIPGVYEPRYVPSSVN